ncbi:MAG: hypothetical protein KGY80_02530 [Candidatus Thorarchaeota archaeon]|nr:hypothetical protein [Candidatus Thorarchaeota archaeon]
MRTRQFTWVLAIVFVLSIPTADTIDCQFANTEQPHNMLGRNHYSASDVNLQLENMWNANTIDNLRNRTRKISDTFPQRVWFHANMTASNNLIDAWSWANQTLKNITKGELVFHQVTEYQHLLTIQEGYAEDKRPAFLVTGIIDSGYSPGANDMGASAAAVLEVSSLLSEYTFPFDVYYLLMNGYHSNSDSDSGSRRLVEWLENNSIQTINALIFDRLLFHNSQYLFGTKTILRSALVGEVYQETQWVPDMIKSFSATRGAGRISQVSNLGVAEKSCAYEMWQVGRPAVHISQGYWPNGQSGTANDLWNYTDYSYEKAGETVSSAASAIYYLGRLGNGTKIELDWEGILFGGESISQDTYVTISCFLNSTIIYNTSNTIRASIVYKDTNETVYQRTEDDGLIKLRYRASSKGTYTVTIKNLGENATACQMNATLDSDCDGDGISDSQELKIGTRVYLRDSDMDGLDDDLELSIETNPCLPDSDGDGASDSQEYYWGSSSTSNDTDGDGLLDGIEIDFGTDLTCNDTDGDGLSDYDEIKVFETDALDPDSDDDGLEDGFEVTYGLNPLSIDSDDDTLTDFFEILNQMDPLSPDSDNDGWGDAYELESSLSPINSDTDGDGLSDGIDWDPHNHWIGVVSPVLMITISSLMGIFALLKYRAYHREETVANKSE